MHDPATQAFVIRSAFGRKDGFLKDVKYYPPILTIWHRDPERSEGKVCRRSDDTCGWSSPSVKIEEWEAVKKLAKEHYSNIFEKQVREREGARDAYICFAPNYFDAVYWAWRAIKRHCEHDKLRVMWQYGDDLSFKEFQAVYRLSATPVANFRTTIDGIKSEDEFVSFFMNIYRCYLRHKRPWYRHPRWHIHHWELQFHPWQALKRRFWDKCCKCGKRGFPKGTSAMGNWSGDQIWHDTCDGARVNAAANSNQGAAT